MIPLRNLRRFYYKTLKQPLYAFNVLLRRSAAHLYYRFSKGASSFPETVTLFLTHSCNLRCRMCGQWGDRGATRKQGSQYVHSELSLQELKSLIDDMQGFRPNITLFGGEPLLHPGCLEVIKYIKQKGQHCLMITNGSLLEGVASQIVESGLDELNVSLDGDSLLHNEIRGMPGLFDKIMHGLKAVHAHKQSLKKKKPLVNLQCTISSYNYMHLERLLDVAKEAQCDSLTFHNLIFLSKELIDKQKKYDEILGCSSADWEGFVFDPGLDYKLLYDKIRKVLSRKYPFDVDFYPNFSYKALEEYYKNPGYLPSDYPARCLSPWTIAYVFPDGEVRPCLNFSYSFGNIRGKSFIDIWNSQEARKFRMLIKEKKLLPVCARCTELYRY